ncbi:MAG: hypothetical protein Q8L53_14225 [Aestuariivirga sp.]|nr:hypothetical protein [Aestuariivirga sp.]
MLTLGTPRLKWKVPVIKTSTTENTGIDELISAIDKHGFWAVESADAQRRNLDAIGNELEALLHDRVFS